MEAKSETTKKIARVETERSPASRAFRLLRPASGEPVFKDERDDTEEQRSSSPGERAAQARGTGRDTWQVYVARVATGGLASVVAVVAVWWGIAVLGNYPTFILPTPLDVAARMWSMLLDGSLLDHLWTTVLEAGLGFVVAFALGTFVGYLIGHSHLLERLLSPYIALSQGLPVVAIAPLLAIWVKNDLTEKIFVVSLIVFFPILVNTVVAVRSIERSMYEVALISGANRLQTLFYVELPLGLRSLLGGVKLGLTLAITGAVIGEFISAGSGLGFLLTLGRGLFDTTLVFVGLVSLAALTIAAYTFVTALEKALITWE